jgi:hypothetical protein
VFYYNIKNERIGHLFQERFKSEPVRSSSARLLPTGRKNAIVGIDIDYETVGANGSMLMVATSGTAVVI